MSARDAAGARIGAAKRGLRDALRAYRLWGNASATATTFAAAGAAAITHADAIAICADELLDALYIAECEGYHFPADGAA